MPSQRSTSRSRPRRAYHHGDLRRALLDAALALVEKEGLAALSLREVAKRAGVTHAAPYHHFADRGALMAAISTEGFERLYQAMAAEIADVDACEPADRRLAAAGRGYLKFALAHPAHFRVMFRPELADIVVDQAHQGETAYHLLEDAVEACRREGLTPPDVEGPLLVISCWSLVHGLAALLLDGPLPLPGGPHTLARGRVKELVRAVPDLFSSLMATAGRAERGPPARTRRSLL